MVIEGTYKLTYTIDDVQHELIVFVELKQVRGIIKPLQNIFHGVAYVNNEQYIKTDLSHCVDAKYAAEEIGLIVKDELKKKFRKENKSFRVKKENVN